MERDEDDVVEDPEEEEEADEQPDCGFDAEVMVLMRDDGCSAATVETDCSFLLLFEYSPLYLLIGTLVILYSRNNLLSSSLNSGGSIMMRINEMEPKLTRYCL